VFDQAVASDRLFVADHRLTEMSVRWKSVICNQALDRLSWIDVRFRAHLILLINWLIDWYCFLTLCNKRNIDLIPALSIWRNPCVQSSFMHLEQSACNHDVSLLYNTHNGNGFSSLFKSLFAKYLGVSYTPLWLVCVKISEYSHRDYVILCMFIVYIF